MENFKVNFKLNLVENNRVKTDKNTIVKGKNVFLIHNFLVINAIAKIIIRISGKVIFNVDEITVIFYLP